MTKINYATKWDYTHASKNYNKRPQYPQNIIHKIIGLTNLNENELVCDIGAGTGYLSLKLSDYKLKITAIEPNKAMRTIGKNSTLSNSNINWLNATAEETREADNKYSMVSFGSSFNVTNRSLALKEANRISKPHGWFLIMWNHRVLDSPLQKKIENCIIKHIPQYDYGVRRKDQNSFLESSNLFSKVIPLQEFFSVNQQANSILNAWKSHQTLKQQAGVNFENIINDIGEILIAQKDQSIETPYVCKAWLAKFKS